MFGFLRSSPSKALEKKYQDTLQQAMQAQRNGDIRLYSELTEKAEAMRKELEVLERAGK